MTGSTPLSGPAGDCRPCGPSGDSAAVPSADPSQAIADLVARHTLDIPDYPKPGILFKDLSPVFTTGEVFAAVVDAVAAQARADRCDLVAGIEARGFILAAAVAYTLGVGMVPIRKAGKLPRATYAASYALEYGEATIEIHQDAVAAGQRVLVVDDVLATGGTADAALTLIDRAGGCAVGFATVLELGFLPGRALLADHHADLPVRALLTV